jgi:hypothetical protein
MICFLLAKNQRAKNARNIGVFGKPDDFWFWQWKNLQFYKSYILLILVWCQIVQRKILSQILSIYSFGLKTEHYSR